MRLPGFEDQGSTRRDFGVGSAIVIVVAQRHHHVEHVRQRRLTLQIGAELVDLVVVLVAAIDRAFGIGPGKQRISSVGKVLPHTQRSRMLDLKSRQLGVVDNRTAVAQQKGVAGIAPILVDLSKPVLPQ